jgi:hypothetical protein
MSDDEQAPAVQPNSPAANSDDDAVNPEDECDEKPADATESEGGEDEPSDGESLGEEEGEEDAAADESDTESVKRHQKHRKLDLIDDAAHDREAGETVKEWKARVAAEKAEEAAHGNGYESSGLEDEDKITYDTDYEEERKAQGKARKTTSSKKRKRIATPEPSDDEEAEQEEEEEEEKEETANKENRKAVAVEDSDIAVMGTLAGTNSAAAPIKGQPPRKKAAHHDLVDIASSARSKKSAPVDPASLVDSPKKKTPKKKKEQQESEDEDKSQTEAAKLQKPAAKKRPPPKDTPTYEVGDRFFVGEHPYTVTWRGENMPTVNGKPGSVDSMVYHPKYWSTAALAKADAAGTFVDTGILELFLMFEKGRPKRVAQKWAVTGWDRFCGQSDKEMIDYVRLAIQNNNLVRGRTSTGLPTQHMLFMPAHFVKVKANARTDPQTGEIHWMPNWISHERDLSQRIDLDGQPIAKPVAAAAAASTSKSKKSKPAAIDRAKEKHSHDVKQMLARTSSNASKPASKAAPAAPAPAAATAAAAAAPAHRASQVHRVHVIGPDDGTLDLNNLFGSLQDNTADSLFAADGSFPEVIHLLFEEFVHTAISKKTCTGAKEHLQMLASKFSDAAMQAQQEKDPLKMLETLHRCSGANVSPLLAMLPYFSERARRFVNSKFK